MSAVREALKDLAYQGLVVRKRGKGPFISERRISESLVQRLTGFHQDMVDRGLSATTTVLEQSVIPASQIVACYLNLPPFTPVVELERLRIVRDEPIALVTTFLPHSLCPEVAHADLWRQSLHEYLDGVYGLMSVRGRCVIEAVPGNEHEAELLRVRQGSPLILLDSVSLLGDSTPIEYYHALHRGDRTRFEVEPVRIREQGVVRVAIGGEPANFPSDTGLT